MGAGGIPRPKPGLRLGKEPFEKGPEAPIAAGCGRCAPERPPPNKSSSPSGSAKGQSFRLGDGCGAFLAAAAATVSLLDTGVGSSMGAAAAGGIVGARGWTPPKVAAGPTAAAVPLDTAAAAVVVVGDVAAEKRTSEEAAEDPPRAEAGLGDVEAAAFEGGGICSFDAVTAATESGGGGGKVSFRAIFSGGG